MASGRGLPEERRMQILRDGRNDLDRFGRIFMPRTFYAETPLFHRRIDSLLMDRSKKKKGIIAPRGHAKSTKVAIVNPLHRTVYNDPNKDLLILLISEAQSQSIAFMNIIGWNLAHNPRIRAVFGNLVGDRWREDELSTTNNVRILARGTGQRVRGTVSGREGITRPNLIILDDFESETNSNTPEAIEKNKKWIAGAVEPSLADDGEIIATGTLISDAAYLSDIMKDPSWEILFFQSLMNEMADGPGTIPIFPSRFSYQDIMDKKASYESRGQGATWWREYMNRCVDMDRQAFKSKWFRRFDGDFILLDGIQPAVIEEREDGLWYVPLYVTVGVDLAIAEHHRADFTVILVLGQSKAGEMYVLDYWRDRVGDTDVIVDQMFNYCSKYGAGLINIETVQYQQAVANAFYKEMAKRNFHIGVETSKPRTAKDARIQALQPEFASGRILHRSWMTELERELESYPKSAHKDLMDALWNAYNVSSNSQLDPFRVGATMKSLNLPERNKEVLDWMLL